MPDVVVIGGGPAGLAASRRLAEGGLSVTLVDEQPELGGQYYRRASPAVLARHGDHRPAGAVLINAVRAAGVDIRTGTAVWGVDDDGHTLLTARGDEVERLPAATILVATGAHERVPPFPGWQLPGVVTPGFAQHLAGEHVRPGHRVVVAGSGPFLLPVACALLGLGVNVLGVAEAGSPYRPRRASFGALRFPARLAELARYAVTLARHRVPVWQGRVVCGARPASDGECVGSVDLARTDNPGVAIATYEVDAVCVGFGFRPQTELLRLLGAAVERDPASGDLLPVVDADGRCSPAHVWVAGEAAGIGGVHAALADGELAAAGILAERGHSGPLTSRRRRRRRTARFAELIASLYPSPAQLADHLMQALPDDSQVCRCEGVNAGRIREAMCVTSDWGAVKSRTRAGMGSCQGRECAVAVAALGRATGLETVRMPVRPVPIGALATLCRSDVTPPPSDGEPTAAAGAA